MAPPANDFSSTQESTGRPIGTPNSTGLMGTRPMSQGGARYDMLAGFRRNHLRDAQSDRDMPPVTGDAHNASMRAQATKNKFAELGNRMSDLDQERHAFRCACAHAWTSPVHAGLGGSVTGPAAAGDAHRDDVPQPDRSPCAVIRLPQRALLKGTRISSRSRRSRGSSRSARTRSRCVLHIP